MRLNGHFLLEIVNGGMPALFRQGLAAVATVLLNRAAGVYGDAAIAGMSVTTRVMMFVSSALIGFGQGYQPVCAFNYGANKKNRVREGYFFCVKYGTMFLLVMAALCLCFAPSIIGWFRDDPQVIAVGKTALRWQAAALPLLAFTVITMTAINAYANRPVELSPIEDAAIVDGQMQIPFEQVADGRLHRFGYTTDNGVTIRFIVIQKPNSSAYGIGLDACDICGETGYYEKGGQVVCKLCDVVMNINTIGFKGGCNPIVIDYSIENGKILVPVEGLVQHESIFK